ncbi:uncharacterized protein LOC106673068 [Cimex lectularius]|uniref:Uncharacterized protein n=1 Tax=Cimex lectularius TaxID=79782 RepID=A0A8I6S7J9_CIMLE|nr:uncharacterized protein LOC106673068 [Cimex lectularius]
MYSKDIAVSLDVQDGRICPQISPQLDRASQDSRIERVQFTMEGTERGPPPTYEEAINPASAPPPTYDSVIRRVREAHKESTGTIDFAKKVALLLVGTLGCTIAIGVTIVIPLAMFIIGSNYLYDCPVNSHIPLYLLIGGLIGLFKPVFHLFHRFKYGPQPRDDEAFAKNSSLQSLLNCSLMAWFILGSYWVYKEYQPNYERSSGERYCNKTVYLFAFWQITFVYILLGITSLCLCSISFCLVAFARRHIRVATPERESPPNE